MQQSTMDHPRVNGDSAAASNHNGETRRLTNEEFDRYSRQMIVPGMGKESMGCCSPNKRPVRAVPANPSWQSNFV